MGDASKVETADERIDRLWAVDLSPPDRAFLTWAFNEDPELRSDVGLTFANLVELDLAETFVRAFVRHLRGHPRCPAGAVLPALENTLEAAIRRGERRATEEVRRWLR